MAYCYEHAESPQYNSDGSLERTFIVHGTNDELQGRGLVANVALPSFEGREREPISAARPISKEAMEFKVTYRLPEVGGSGTGSEPGFGGGIMEFDTGGATQHITTATLNQFHYPPNAPNMKGAIGVTSDGVEGCDIVVPKLEITITKHFAIGALNGDSVKALARLTGKTNLYPYSIDGALFDEGELLCLGATGSCRGRLEWEVTLRFSASQNVYGMTIGPISGIEKYGHDYIWALFKHEQSGTRLVQVPQAIYVAWVYEPVDFFAVLGF